MKQGSGKALKRASDAVFVLAIALLVVAIATSTAVFYLLAGLALLASIVLTVVKRRLAKARAKQAQRAASF